MRTLKTDPKRFSFQDVVLLVPGFLGLGRLGTFYYFSERIAAALRTGIEARTGRPVLVVPCSTRPTGSLESRQVYLLNQLQQVYDALPKLERIHLVGHSAGAVDAQLLACDKPISTESWEPFAARKLLRSVVGIAAPYHGTYLASSKAVQTLRGHPSRVGAGDLLTLVARLNMLLFNPALGDLLAGVRTQFPEAVAFLAQMALHREILNDLDPEVMAKLRARVKPDKSIPLTSFVTVAGMRETDAHSPSPDPFFRKLYELCGENAKPMPEALRVLSSAQARGPFDAKTCDGVVNSMCQLLDPSDPNELGAVVMADHADVIGDYDRAKKLLETRAQRIGVFHSGSGFDDDEFFQLYGRVVETICRQIPGDEAARAGRAHPPNAPLR
jgi:pimeloyl-ACP methyl ester carboxylesterase